MCTQWVLRKLCEQKIITPVPSIHCNGISTFSFSPSLINRCTFARYKLYYYSEKKEEKRKIFTIRFTIFRYASLSLRKLLLCRYTKHRFITLNVNRERVFKMLRKVIFFKLT